MTDKHTLPNGSQIRIIEGLISSGKSTLIRSLETSPAVREFFDDVVAFSEPIKQRTFEAYLSDQRRYAYSFQTNTALKRIQMRKDAKRVALEKPRRLVLIDRGLDGDQAFALSQLRLGLMDQADFSLYQEEIGVDDGSLEQLQEEPGFRVVYLKCSPLTSWARTLKRGNVSETATYDENYMETLFEAHEEMMEKNPLVLVKDWDEPRAVINGVLSDAEVRAYLTSTL